MQRARSAALVLAVSACIGGWAHAAGLSLAAPGKVKAPLGQTTRFFAKASKGALLSVAPQPLPAGASFDPVSGEFEFTPGAMDVDQSLELVFSAFKGDQQKSKHTTIVVTALPSGGPTIVKGQVRASTSEKPLKGVPLSIDETGPVTLTNKKGKFTLVGVDKAASVVKVNGAPKGYAFVAEDIELMLDHPIFEGQVNVIERPIYLPLLGDAAGEIVDGGGHLENPDAGVSLDVLPASATQGTEGELYSGPMFIPKVEPDLTPAALPANLTPGLVVAIQPAGLKFYPPAPITFANDEGFAPGSLVDLWSIDPATGMFAIAGKARVSTDGSIVSTDPSKVGAGATGGVHYSSWHFVLPPGIDPVADENQNNNTNQDPDGETPICSGSMTTARSGALMVEHETVPYRSLDASHSVRLVYDSLLAHPMPVVSVVPTIPVQSTIPKWMSTKLEVAGLAPTQEIFTDTSGLNESLNEQLLQVGIFDGIGLSTGLHPYGFTLTNYFAASTVSAGGAGNLLVRNEAQSPIGAGWTIGGVDSVMPVGSGQVLLIEGAGATRLFSEDSGDAHGLRMRMYPAVSVTQVVAGFPGISPQLFSVASAGSTVVVQDYVVPVVNFADTNFDQLAFYDVGANGVIDAGSTVSLPQGDDLAIQPQGGNDHFGAIFDGYVMVPTGGDVTFTVYFDDAFALYVDDVLVKSSSGVCDNCTAAVTVPGLAAGFVPIRLHYAENGGEADVVLGAFGGGFPGGIIPADLLVPELPRPRRGDVAASFRGPLGDFSKLTLFADGTFTQKLPDGTKKLFDADGRLVAREDRNGNAVRFAYNGAGMLKSITDAVGAVTTFDYAGALLSSIRDPAGRTTALEHDGARDLTRITDPDGAHRDFEYSAHRLTKQADALGVARRYEYDLAGRHVRTTFADGTTREVHSAQSFGVSSAGSADGTKDKPLPVVRPTDVIASFTDENGHTTKYELDKFGGGTSIVDPLGRSTAIVRDNNGLPTKVTAPSGAVTTFGRDSSGNLTSISQQGTNGPGPDDRTSIFLYNEFSQVTRFVNAEQKINAATQATIAFEYDEKGNLTSIIDAAGTETVIEYDDAALNPTDVAGLLTRVTEARDKPEERTTAFGYDAATGNRDSVEGPGGRVTRLAFDGVGRLVEAVNEGDDGASSADPKTRYEYAPKSNLLVRLVDALGGTTKYTYDAVGHVTAMTGPNGSKLQWDYDDRGRVKRRVDALGHVEAYTYDAKGNLATYVDRTGRTFSFTFDAADRVTKRAFPDPHAPGGVGDVTLGYDGNHDGVSTNDGDGLATAVNPWVTTTITYDVFGDAIASSTAGSSAVPPVTLAYAYNKDRTLKSMAAAGLVNVQYGYDLLDRSATVTDSMVGLTTTFGYDALSRRTSTTRALSGHVIATGYDYTAAGELLAVEHRLDPTGANSLLSSIAYEYDSLGRRQSLLASRPLLGFAGDESTYGYDAIGQLTSVVRKLQASVVDPVTMPADEQELFQYDGAGNRTASGVGGPIWDYNKANQLLDDGVFLYEYDLNGNQVARTSKANALAKTTYEWDPENRLIRVTLPDATVLGCVYDALGRRVARTVSGVNPTSEAFIHDGADVVLEYAKSGATFTLARRIARTLEVDEALAFQDTGMPASIVLAGESGSVSEVITPAGALVGGRRYSGFGLVKEYQWGTTFAAGYTGRELEREAGLWFYRARFMDPATGRFLSEDPASTAWRTFGYASNDGINHRDPTGLEAVPAPTLPNGDPAPPPVALPPGKNGEPNEWVPVPGTPDRPTKWKPKYPVTSDKGGQPSGSWDPEDGDWGIDDGTGGPREHCDPDGNPVHRFEPTSPVPPPAPNWPTPVIPWWVIIPFLPWPGNPLYGFI